MKTYIGRRHGTLGDSTTVVVADEAGVKDLFHIAYHSPTGFEWGYNGSGPADLALAILADHFGEGENQVLSRLSRFFSEEPLSQAVAFHQTFKDTVVARLTGPEWSMTSEEVERWLQAHGGRVLVAGDEEVAQ